MPFEQLFKKHVPTLEQMHSLVKFVEQGSLSAAFGSGKSAQAAATQQLGRIDKCLGIRTRRSSGAYKVPTDQAREVATICRDFFQRLEDFKKSSERKPNTFVVGAGDSLMFYLLIPALRHSGEWRHSVELHLQNMRSREIVNGLLDGSVDIGLVRTSAIEKGQISRRLNVTAVCSLEYAFFVRRELLKNYSGNFDDERSLVEWSVQNLSLATFWGELSTFTEALGKTKLAWPTQLRCVSFPQVKEAVVAGDYCGILPRDAFGKSLPDDIQSFGSKLLVKARREIGLVWSSTLTERRPGGEAALNEIRRSLKKLCAS